MINLYIDESGSLTAHSDESKQHFFIICILKVNEPNVLRKDLKRFISSNFKTLKQVDKNNRMFINGKFRELKGSALNGALKKEFVEKISRNKSFEVYYIKVLNKKLKSAFIGNKARAFNFLLKLFFQFHLRLENFYDDDYFLQIDERNIKTESRNTLEDYLNTELILEDNLLTKPVKVQYFDSSNNKFIQVADVFANLYYSECLTNSYGSIIKDLEGKGIIKKFFVFPKKVN